MHSLVIKENMCAECRKNISFTYSTVTIQDPRSQKHYQQALA